MDQFFIWLSNNSIAANVFIFSFVALVVFIIIIYGTAFFRGQEISFGPAKIGARPDREKNGNSDKFDKVKENGITLISPTNGATVGSTINIRGNCHQLPAGTTLQVFTISPERLYRPQLGARIIIDKDSKQWHASLNADSIEMKVGQSKTIGIALMGEAGEALCQYFWKAGKLAGQFPGIEKLTPDIAFFGEATVTRA